MQSYIINSVLCIALLLGFYMLFLEKKKMHQFNRFYLLGALLFSITVPGMEIGLENDIYNMNSYVKSLSYAIPNNFINSVLSIYIIVAAILTLKFVLTLYTIAKKIRYHKKVYLKHAVIVLVKDKVLPHTFLQYVFVNEDDYKNDLIEQELFTHEYTHVRERHTIDILFIEILHIIFWFNPFMILMKKAIRLNHEYIADDTVITTHKDAVSYQEILLNIATWKNRNALTSNANYSATKKRFQMMYHENSRIKNGLVVLAIAPMIIALFFFFAQITIGGEHHNEHSSDSYSKVEHH